MIHTDYLDGMPYFFLFDVIIDEKEITAKLGWVSMGLTKIALPLIDTFSNQRYLIEVPDEATRLPDDFFGKLENTKFRRLKEICKNEIN